MAIRYRRRIRLGKHAWVNVSKSGVSVSAKTGPVTLNSRGTESVHLAKGLTYQTKVTGQKATPQLAATAQTQAPAAQKLAPRVVSRGMKRLVIGVGIVCAAVGLLLVPFSVFLGVLNLTIGIGLVLIGRTYEVKPQE